MRRWLSMLLTLVMLLSSLSLGAFAEDGADDVSYVPVETIGEDAPESVPAEAPEEDEAGDTAPEDAADADEETAPADEADEEDAAQSEDEDAQPEQTEETADEAAQAAAFAAGYVLAPKKTAFYETMNENEVYGVFSEDSVVWAEVSMKSNAEGKDWLALTVETEKTKAEEAEFLTVYLRVKAVTPLTKQESEAFEAGFASDESARLYRNHPLAVSAIRLTVAQTAAEETAEVFESAANEAVEATAEQTNEEESAPDANTSLTVNYPSEPLKVPDGGTVKFTVTSSGATAYAWLVNRNDGNGFVELSETATWHGVNTNTLTFTATAARAAYTYKVRVSNGTSNAVSGEMHFNLLSKPTVVTQPKNITINKAGTVVFVVAFAGADTIRWQVDRNNGNGFVDLSDTASYKGSATATLSVNADSAKEGYLFRAVGSNAAGQTQSTSAKYNLIVLPVFSAQPVHQTAAEGTKAVFTVSANNADSISWQVDRGEGFVDLNDTATYTGTHTATLSVVAREGTAAYTFRAVASNADGQVFSDTVTFTLILKPVITTQPVNQIGISGSTVSFTVKGKNIENYQWQVDRKDGSGFTNLGTTVTYSGSTTDTLTVSVRAATASYSYRVKVSNDAGEVISNTVTFTCLEKPTVKTQPKSQTVADGAYAEFTAAFNNADKIQWQVDRADGKGFVNLSNSTTYQGVTTGTLSVKAGSGTEGYKFHAVGSNDAGETATNSVKITRIVKPVIDTQPVNATAAVNTYATFTVVSKNADSFQWQVDRKDGSGYVDLGSTATYQGADTKTLSVKATSSTALYSFRAVCTNIAGSTNSSAVKLTCVLKPVIDTQPSSQKGVNGATISFHVVSNNAANIQWQVDRQDGNGFTDLSDTATYKGTKTGTLTVSVRPATAAYKFRAVASNIAGEAISKTVSFTCWDAPVIKTQPKNKKAAEGTSVTISAVSKNGETIQWQVNRNDGNGFVDLTETGSWHGTDTDVLTFTATASKDGFRFRLVVSNVAGKVTSDAVTFTCVTVPVFETQPVTPQTVAEGTTVSFTAISANADSIKWQVNRNDGNGYVDLGNTATYSGATTNTLSIAVSTKTASYKYRAVATNIAGSANSRVATFVCVVKPKITTQPVSQKVLYRSEATLTVNSSNADSYYWQVDKGSGFEKARTGDYISGVSTNTLTVTANSTTAAYKFRAVAVNIAGETYSNTVTVTGVKVPSFDSQPKNQSGYDDGDTVTFTCASSNADSVKWQVDRKDGSGFVDLNESPTYSGVKTYALTCVVKESLKDYKFRAVLTNIAGSTESNSVSITIPTPSKPDFSLACTDNVITVSWSKVDHATGYVVYYSTSSSISSSSTLSVTASATATSKKLSGLQYGTTYYVWVKSKNGGGECSTPSYKSIKTAVDITSVSLSSSSKTLYVPDTYTLTASLSPSSYSVSITETWSSSNTSVATVSKSGTHSAVVTAKGAGTATITYKVVSSTGKTLTASCTITGTYTTPGTPSITGTSATTTSVTLTWSSASYATGYLIYYSTSSSIPSSAQKTVGNVTSATITGLSSGTTYYFWVRATNNGTLGSASSYKTVKTVDTAPGVPSISSAAVNKNKVTLTWSKVSGASSYKVYMLKGSSGTPTTLAASGITGTSYTVTGLDKKTTYRFAVSAVSSGGVESAKSSAVNATTENKDGIATGRALLISESTFDWNQNPDNWNNLGAKYTIMRNKGDIVRVSSGLSNVKTSTGNSWTIKTADNSSNSEIKSLISSTFAAADDDDISLFMIATHGDTSGGSTAGALCTYYGTTMQLSTLAGYLKAVPGNIIIYVSSCGSGAGVYANSANASGNSSFNVDAVIQAFSRVDSEIVVEQTLVYYYDEEGNEIESDSAMAENTGEFRVANKFYVLTAADYMQTSWGWEDFSSTSNSYNEFGYHMKAALSGSSKMAADSNSNGQLTLQELYSYMYSALRNATNPSTVRVYPTSSSFVLFTK